MRGYDDIENNVHDIYTPMETGGARQRRGPNSNGNDQKYSSLPTQPAQHGGYGPESYSTPTFNTLSQRTFAVCNAPQEPSHFFASTAHLTEGPKQPFYRDNFNDQSFSCDFGTGEEHGIWMNTSDQAGTVSRPRIFLLILRQTLAKQLQQIMAILVWFLMGYSAWTFTALASAGSVPPFLSAAYVVLCCLALSSHAKTTFTGA